MRIPSLLVVLPLALVTGCGSQGGATPLGTHPISWADNYAVLAHDQAVPPMTAKGICGSSTATFLTELEHTSITKAKVKLEWADVVPGGRQVAISGIVETNHEGPTDLPMSHETGDDLSMNVLLDSVYDGYTRQLGNARPEQGPQEFHVEIASGYIPHVPRPASPSTGQTWDQMATKNLTGFQPGFDRPAVNDRALVQGRWIIDCGHDNYGTELHAISFLAWAHVEGGTTTARAFYNPYRDTGYFNPDFSILGNVGDTSRMSLPDTKTFPDYLVDEVIRLVSGLTTRLRSYGVVSSVKVSPQDWRVCAPATTRGGQLVVHYDFVTRSGISITETPDLSTGCVTLHTVIGKTYRPAALAMRQCVLPWTYLDKIAGQATGNPSLDIKKLIVDQVGQQNASKFDADPVAGCADALQGPKIDPAPTGQTLKVDDGQPFPFYGVVTVAWK